MLNPLGRMVFLAGKQKSPCLFLLRFRILAFWSQAFFTNRRVPFRRLLVLPCRRFRSSITTVFCFSCNICGGIPEGVMLFRYSNGTFKLQLSSWSLSALRYVWFSPGYRFTHKSLILSTFSFNGVSIVLLVRL